MIFRTTASGLRHCLTLAVVQTDGKGEVEEELKVMLLLLPWDQSGPVPGAFIIEGGLLYIL